MRTGLFVLVLMVAGVGRGQERHLKYYEFHFVRAGMPVPEYLFRVCRSEDCVDPDYTTMGATPGQPDSRTVQPLHLSPAMQRRIAELFEQTHGLSRCASRAKGIADTGTKTLSVVDNNSAVDVSCTYNYSDSKPVVELTSIFQGMAFTLDEGHRLERLQRYDRLSLDAEMKSLYDAAKAGQALEMGNIAGELKALADDTEVLQRVRERAADLFKMGAGS